MTDGPGERFEGWPICGSCRPEQRTDLWFVVLESGGDHRGPPWMLEEKVHTVRKETQDREAMRRRPPYQYRPVVGTLLCKNLFLPFACSG